MVGRARLTAAVLGLGLVVEGDAVGPSAAALTSEGVDFEADGNFAQHFKEFPISTSAKRKAPDKVTLDLTLASSKLGEVNLLEAQQAVSDMAVYLKSKIPPFAQTDTLTSVSGLASSWHGHRPVLAGQKDDVIDASEKRTICNSAARSMVEAAKVEQEYKLAAHNHYVEHTAEAERLKGALEVSSDPGLFAPFECNVKIEDDCETKWEAYKQALEGRFLELDQAVSHRIDSRDEAQSKASSKLEDAEHRGGLETGHLESLVTKLTECAGYKTESTTAMCVLRDSLSSHCAHEAAYTTAVDVSFSRIKGDWELLQRVAKEGVAAVARCIILANMDDDPLEDRTNCTRRLDVVAAEIRDIIGDLSGDVSLVFEEETSWQVAWKFEYESAIGSAYETVSTDIFDWKQDYPTYTCDGPQVLLGSTCDTEAASSLSPASVTVASDTDYGSIMSHMVCDTAMPFRFSTCT